MRPKLATFNGMDFATARKQMRLPDESKKNATLTILRSRSADTPHRIFVEAKYADLAVTYPQLLCFKTRFPEINVYHQLQGKSALHLEFSIPNLRLTNRPGFFDDQVKWFTKVLEDLFIFPRIQVV